MTSSAYAVELIDANRAGSGWPQGPTGRPGTQLFVSVFRHLPAIAIGAVIVVGAWFLPESIGTSAKMALAITGLAIVGWTATPLPDSVVAVAAALLLVVTGVLPEKQLYSALGSELIWLLVAAFVIAAVVKGSGLMERLAFAAVRPFSGITAFFHAIAFVISITAFLIPSTSGRAALLLPVYMALAERMPGAPSRRALALLFPTVILLSAGGSMIGAGAHFVAVEAIYRAADVSIGYIDWLLLAFPLTLLASHAAVALIIALFVPKDERRAVLSRPSRASAPLSKKELRIGIALAVIVTLWLTAPWHGMGIALVAFGGAIVLLTSLFNSEKPKEVFRKVEVELLIFLAATFVIADAVILSGASTWMAQGAMALLPERATASLPLIVIFLTVIAVLSHLVINSRTARAAVLIPALSLPIAGFGHDVTLMVLVTVLGTGFCQTLMVSAKPVVIFGNAQGTTFTQSDLTRLAIPLLPIKALLIIGFALFVWPHQLPTPQPADTKVAHVHDLASIPAARAAPAADPEPVLAGALCTRPQLQTVMLATIRERKMWASGWWHVWDRLKRDGFRVERGPVKQIYRAENMVLLRPNSTRLAAGDLAPESVAAARAACADPIPAPRPNPRRA